MRKNKSLANVIVVQEGEELVEVKPVVLYAVFQSERLRSSLDF